MYRIIIQQAASTVPSPKPALLRHWAKKVLSKQIKSAEVTIRLVTVCEMRKLNAKYRQKQGVTNILSFPFESPQDVKLKIPILGDLVICSEIVNKEAIIQNKNPDSHWAHMIVHGICHLLGYDHEEEHQAAIMESFETELLTSLGFTNPYWTQ